MCARARACVCVCVRARVLTNCGWAVFRDLTDSDMTRSLMRELTRKSIQIFARKVEVNSKTDRAGVSGAFVTRARARASEMKLTRKLTLKLTRKLTWKPAGRGGVEEETDSETDSAAIRRARPQRFDAPDRSDLTRETAAIRHARPQRFGARDRSDSARETSAIRRGLRAVQRPRRSAVTSVMTSAPNRSSAVHSLSHH